MAKQIITIKNEKIKVEISTLGAEMQSIMSNDKEYLWNGDPDVWKSRAPVLFPICGGLKDDKYEYNGKEYTLIKHGYARFCEFDIESYTEDSAVFLLKSDDESKKYYPFSYELRISYILDGASVKVGYSVTNMSNEDMYFSIGAHEGYMCPEGIEEYSLIFDVEEHLTTNKLNGNLLTEEVEIMGDNLKELPLKYDYFMDNTLTFLNLKSTAVTLKHKENKRQLRVDFEGFNYMFVWTMADKFGKYICIEPWCGIPDFVGSTFDFTKKKGINKISAGESFERTHIITIEG